MRQKSEEELSVLTLQEDEPKDIVCHPEGPPRELIPPKPGERPNKLG